MYKGNAKSETFEKRDDTNKFYEKGRDGKWDYMRVISKSEEKIEKPKEEKETTTTDVKIDKNEISKIVSKQPKISNYGGKGGNYKIDEKTKTIEFNHSFPREARHPEEYGKRGEIAANKMDEFDGKFYDEVIEPLTKLGYKVESYEF